MSLWPEIRAAKNGEFWKPVGSLVTINGTGIPDPFGPGFSGDLARELERVADGMWVWVPIGYPAAVYPMADSVQAGRRNVVAEINRHPGKIVLSGYSQGALVTDIVWRDDILSPAGELHHRLEDVLAIINFGDPMRCPGIANGNKIAGQPLPSKLDGYVTGGIAGPGCLRPEETPDFLLSFANDGDLYACAPVGKKPWDTETEVGHNETMIFDMVMKTNLKSIMALAKEMIEIVSIPMSQLLPLVQAIWNGLVFMGQGTNAPHWAYRTDAAVRYLIDLGNRERVR